MDRALLDFYEANPQIKERNTRRALLELLAPLGAGMIGSRILQQKGHPLYSLPTTIGAVAGASAFLSGVSSRRKNVLADQGIQSDLLGLRAKPINAKGRVFFDE